MRILPACRAGDDMHCSHGVFPGIDADGGFAEFLKTGARAVVKLDPKTGRKMWRHWPMLGSRPTTR